MVTRAAKPTSSAKPSPSKKVPAKAGKGAAIERKGDSQSSFVRMLGLLDLFTPAASVRPVTDLVNYLGTSRSTSYR